MKATNLAAAVALTVLAGAPALAITPEVATHVLIFGNMIFSLTESDRGYRVEGTTETGTGRAVPFVMTIRKNQGCVVEIETVRGPHGPGVSRTEVRTTDWTSILVDDIRVSSRPVPEGGPDASYRTITIPGGDRFMCVREIDGPREQASAAAEERCTSRLVVEGAHLPGQRNIHDMHKQALAAVSERCAGKRPNLEPQSGAP